MEVGIVTTLEKHIADAKGLPAVRTALTKHLKETKRHAAEMKKALNAMGGTHPIIKEGVSKLANLAAGMVTTAAKDTVVKNAIADFAMEHFEMACYKSLILTATALGEKQIAAACQGILKEEQAMAAVLDKQFKGINDSYLRTLESDEKEAPARKAPTRRVAPKASTGRKAPASKRPNASSAKSK